jgi:pre-mRNA-splicing factor 38B
MIKFVYIYILGAKVKAIYSDDENEPCWYEAVIDSVALEFNNKYWVTFPEYGNSECIDLGTYMFTQFYY